MNLLEAISIRAARFALTASLSVVFLGVAAAQPLGDSTATTESSCTFGMTKGEARQSCTVPFLQGCVVAHFPGTTRPWSNISKGGFTTCRFNEKDTDWKTWIRGTCERCQTAQCSARFGVMFNCAANLPPRLPHSPQQTPP